MNKLLLILVALVALAGCGKDNSCDAPPRPIGSVVDLDIGVKVRILNRSCWHHKGEWEYFVLFPNGERRWMVESQL